MIAFNPGAGRRLAVGVALTALTLLADQASKRLILLDYPQAREQRVPALPFLDIVLTWNRGVSFSIGNNLGPSDRIVFAALALAVTLALMVWIARGAKPLVLTALGMVAGGALGNALDRVRFGAVEDFIYVHIGAFDWWPVFNLADSAICVGAGLLIFDSLFDRPLSHKNTP